MIHTVFAIVLAWAAIEAIRGERSAWLAAVVFVAWFVLACIIELCKIGLAALGVLAKSDKDA